MVKLTITIPTFNGGKNLERAIRSCGNIQLSTEDYEILVIDNCSTGLIHAGLSTCGMTAET